MLINQLLNTKGHQVFTVSPEETVSAIAALLYARRVGAFIVADKIGRVVGIVSERDVIRALAQIGPDALSRAVTDIMTKDVISASPCESIEVLLDRMTDRRIRHLPVMDGTKLVGIVSIGDLVKARISVAEAEAQGLKAYIAAG
ncbi:MULTISPECIES: CBS domain-containing protein [Asticcacaulis]|uniref:Histidine kinase n=1 Tax=Asticcacaulis endophyticus TaxID=1395890 RepID=A0A918QGB5_9CAUL|nr:MULTISPECIES: CBS domain-containing protein [Asticcacaulis]WAC49202.1 CBS domain-containing protein [Asticcacaulis sp. SL142]WKL56976.1 CBS domain-containing protein [Asticcacaulis sp. ZE23SCel15]GGZ43837.1 histidine kinase [Asticcacaulis endophyticus]